MAVRKKDTHVAPPPPEYGMWLISGERTVQRVLDDKGAPALFVRCPHPRDGRPATRRNRGAGALVKGAQDELLKDERHMVMYPCSWTMCPRRLEELG